MQDFKNLSVWQSARMLTRSVYGITARYPENERYGLTSQMRRAAVSICSNIAESCGRGSDADAKRFLHAAMGSACELESHTILSADLSMMTAQVHGRLVEEIVIVKKMLAGLIRQLAVKKQGNWPRADS